MSRGMGPSHRTLQVGEVLRRAIAENLLLLEEGALSWSAVTITEVKMSKDLKQAWVYFVLMEGADPDLYLKGLAGKTHELHRRLCKIVQLKRMPRINFMMDHSFGKAQHIHALLKEIAQQGESGENSSPSE